MKMRYAIGVMIIGSFLIQYYFMSRVMTNTPENITNSLGKFYISCVMGISMGILEVAMHDFSGGHFNFKYYLPLGILLVVFIVLYRNQAWINDKQYLEEMIEHHSMAIFTSEEILNKTHSYQVSRLAKNILQNQKDEINEMRRILKGVKTATPRN
jgi:hypothetical protein